MEETKRAEGDWHADSQCPIGTENRKLTWELEESPGFAGHKRSLQQTNLAGNILPTPSGVAVHALSPLARGWQSTVHATAAVMLSGAVGGRWPRERTGTVGED